MGISAVKLKIVEGEYFQTRYNPDTRSIEVNSEFLRQDSEQILMALLRTCYRVYQSDCLALLSDQDIANDKLLMFKNIRLKDDDNGSAFDYTAESNNDDYEVDIKSAGEETAYIYSLARKEYYDDYILAFYRVQANDKMTEPIAEAVERNLDLPDHLHYKIEGDQIVFNYRPSDEDAIIFLSINREDDSDLYYMSESEQSSDLTVSIDKLPEGHYDISVKRVKKGRYTDVERAYITVGEQTIIEGSNDEVLKHNAKYNSNASQKLVEFTIVADSIFEKSQEIVSNKGGDLDRARALHDWICKNIHYQRSNGVVRYDYMDDPVEALKERRSVCSGIARLYHEMLIAAEIPSRVVEGYVTDEKGLNALSLDEDVQPNHAWNQVYIEELQRWINVDVTYDLDAKQPEYNNFAFSDEKQSAERIIVGYDEDYDCVVE